jgi:tetratricopeptide (TPR) repeat protein
VRTARALVALGDTHVGRDGRCEDACPLFENALEIRRRVLPPNDIDMVASLESVALCRTARGEFEQARALYKESLAILQTAHQRNHPESIDVMRVLAVLLQSLNATTRSE